MKLVLALIAALAVPGSAFASLVAYTDRSAFEAALGSFTVDSLDGVTPSYHYQDVRADFVLDSPGMYGCINHGGCEPATPGFDNAYLWHYTGQDTFTFSTAVFGLGFDFNGDPLQAPSGARPIIQGLTSGSAAGFFGVISSVALNVWTLDQTSSFMLIDNVTYNSSLAPVPVPAALPLLLAALGGLGFVARRRKAA